MRLVPVLVMLAAAPLIAQEAQPSYRVDYAVKEGASQMRRYSILLESGNRGSFRVGTRVPYPTGQGGGFQYADIGVNIDARLTNTGRALVLETNLEISSIQPEQKGAPVGAMPLIAQVRTNVTNQMPLGKGVVIAVIDDPVTLRKFEIEATLTATK